MFINHSTPGVLEVCMSSDSNLVKQAEVLLGTVSNFAMVHQNSVLTSDAALRDAHLQIKGLQQQIEALAAKNLVLEHDLARKEKTEDRLRRGYEGEIRDLIQDHHVVIESYRADIDRLITENQFWKKTSLKVVTDLTIMSNQNTRHKEELATYKIVSIGVVALCSLYPLASKFCTTETARMIANGAVQLCSALKRGLTGARADQLV